MQKTGEIPQVLFFGEVVDAPVVVQRQVPGMVQTVLKTVEVPQLQYSDKVVDVPVVQVPQIQFIAGVSGQSSCTETEPFFQKCAETGTLSAGLWRR